MACLGTSDEQVLLERIGYNGHLSETRTFGCKGVWNIRGGALGSCGCTLLELVIVFDGDLARGFGGRFA